MNTKKGNVVEVIKEEDVEEKRKLQERIKNQAGVIADLQGKVSKKDEQAARIKEEMDTIRVAKEKAENPILMMENVKHEMQDCPKKTTQLVIAELRSNLPTWIKEKREEDRAEEDADESSEEIQMKQEDLPEEEIKYCFNCGGEHETTRCPGIEGLKMFCVGCAQTSHSYKDCCLVEETCEVCDVEGHHKSIHEETNKLRRILLINYWGVQGLEKFVLGQAKKDDNGKERKKQRTESPMDNGSSRSDQASGIVKSSASVDRSKKTAICRFWLNNGSCRKGSRCKFAHGHAELSSASIGIKTVLCYKYEDTGRCDYGESCRFAHGERELKTGKQQGKNIEGRKGGKIDARDSSKRQTQ